MKAKARTNGADIIDFGMGNPDLPTPSHVVDKLKEWGLCDDRENGVQIVQTLMHFRLMKRLASKNPLFKDRKEKFYAAIKSGST
jgi:hypothetical protein